MSIQTLSRKFKVGARLIDAPLENGSLEDNVKVLMENYPMFRWTRVLESDGEIVGDTLVYTLQLPPVKVNG